MFHKKRRDLSVGRQSFRHLFLASVVAAGAALGSGQATALVVQPDPFGSYAPVTDNALDELRGGFRFGGFNFHFGLRIHSVINNALELVTEFTMDMPGMWNPSRSEVRVLDEARAAELTGGGHGSATTQQASSGSSSSPSQTAGTRGTSLPPALPDPKPASTSTPESSSTASASAQPKSVAPSSPSRKVGSNNDFEVSLGSTNIIQAVHKVTRDHILQLFTARGSNLDVAAKTEFNINVLDFRNVVKDHMSGIRSARIVESGRF